jgi:hypothetical protein
MVNLGQAGMRHEEKDQFGLLGEHACLDVLRWQVGLEVKLNTGPGFMQGFGIRFHSGYDSEVVPDLDIIRFPERTHEYVEVKTKAGFCMWNYDKPGASVSSRTLEIRTGIDLKYWDSYWWYACKYHNEPLWIMFVHPSPTVQLRKREYIDWGTPGIYMQEITILDSLSKQDASSRYGQMVYWRVKDLILFRTETSLLKRDSTAQLWRQLQEAAEQSKRRRLLKRLDDTP